MLIAHRLSTVRNVDQIIVMSNGEIQEAASSSGEKSAYDILAANPGGAFSRLLSMQEAQQESTHEKPLSTAEILEKCAPLDVSPVEERSGLDVPDLPLLSVTATRLVADDIEASKTIRRRAFLLTAWRLLRLSGSEQWRYALGLVCTAGRGFVFPIFSLIYAGYVSAFSDKGGITKKDGDFFAMWTFVIAVIEAVLCFVQQWTLGTLLFCLSLLDETF